MVMTKCSLLNKITKKSKILKWKKKKQMVFAPKQKFVTDHQRPKVNSFNFCKSFVEANIPLKIGVHSEYRTVFWRVNQQYTCQVNLDTSLKLRSDDVRLNDYAEKPCLFHVYLLYFIYEQIVGHQFFVYLDILVYCQTSRMSHELSASTSWRHLLTLLKSTVSIVKCTIYDQDSMYIWATISNQFDNMIIVQIN